MCSSSVLKVRRRRAGCLLVTCAYSDLLHRLLLATNRQIDTTAPQAKIESKGYGRRRRRTPQGEPRPSAAASPPCRVKRSCTAA